ncbi:MAG: TIGR00282 family metallophosphoesterase [Candidatus Krumholzibacteriota bacterium]|nr:TIGR00282 family metallophosphoesterase [Candidatus Krumholzibacteriota bacterium]
MNLLMIGDILSKEGRKALRAELKNLKKRLAVDFCTANVENAAGMFGLTRKVAQEIMESGVDVMTSGNHIWDKREGVVLLDEIDNLIRPANYPPGVPGKGHITVEVGGRKLCIINLQGRTFMPAIDCPFRCADSILQALPRDIKVIAVDFHAEATSEKLALGNYLDGRVSVVAGTHTHIPTADERIFPGGTAYQTDIGMAGPYDSIIGVKQEQVIERFLKGINIRFQVGGDTPCIEGLLVDIDESTGKARRIERIHELTGGDADETDRA